MIWQVQKDCLRSFEEREGGSKSKKTLCAHLRSGRVGLSPKDLPCSFEERWVWRMTWQVQRDTLCLFEEQEGESEQSPHSFAEREPGGVEVEANWMLLDPNERSTLV